MPAHSLSDSTLKHLGKGGYLFCKPAISQKEMTTSFQGVSDK